MNKINILLTSVGRRSYLVKYFKEALAGIGKVYVSNSSAQSPAFQVADGAVVSPLIYDDNYIPFLLNYCKANDISAIISLFDVDLPILAKNKNFFAEQGVTVIVSDYCVIEKCNDKYSTYKFLLENGFNAPKTYINLDCAIEEINNKELYYPVFVKPRWGMGSIAVYEACNDEELIVFYKKVKREIQKSYLKYESNIDIDNSVLIQEKLKGQEYGLDVINDLNGRYQNTIVKKKIAMRSGETDCATTLSSELLNKLGESLSDKLKHIANLDVDVFVVDGKPYVLEMNARFGGGYPFSHMAGVNLPKAIVGWLVGEKIDSDTLVAKEDITCQKDIDIVYLKNSSIDYKFITRELIEKAVTKLEKFISPNLSERGIVIKDYARKIDSNGIAIAAVDRNEIVGILTGYVNYDQFGYISLFSIDDEHQGVGIGKNLYRIYEQIAHDNGLKTIKLQVRKHNSKAISIYKHFGFEIVEEASETSYYMTKTLD